ncbi:MAG: hypothetical protein DRQ62_07085 [Gammaproteobacteria bacterium]|nr:MAG: hypothetical protein DRQ62_07085 [Gammaproteobacteria bacterium]
MAVFLERINAVPVVNREFSFEFLQWLTTMVDSLNSVLEQIQDNVGVAQQYTTVQITANLAAWPNGQLFYDTTLNQLQAKVNGALVVLA